MRIMFVGGGTGGHFYPLIATAEALKTRQQQNGRRIEFLYIGPTPYNRPLLQKHNIRYVYCPAGKIRRYFSPLNLLDLGKTMLGILVAIWQLYVYYPDVVFSKSGYTSVPVVLAAWLLRIPIVIHESDAKPGRANLLAKRFARYIAISYTEAAQYFPKEKTALTGIPLQEHMRQPIEDPHAYLGIATEPPLILVTGGSLGAERINNLILDSLDELLPHYQILHQTGKPHIEQITHTAAALVTDKAQLARYYVYESLDPQTFAAAQAAASIVITRAGSTTLAEIAQHRTPAIVIPIPEEISHDQRRNAYAYARATGASVMEEQNLNDALLVAEITRIMSDERAYQEMVAGTENFTHPDAADKIADVLISIGNEHGS